MEGIEIQIPVTAEQMEIIRNAWAGMKLVWFNFREIEAEERKCNIVQTDFSMDATARAVPGRR